MTRIIGHRGAAGIELENTMPSFQKAFDLGVKAVEFDVRATRDGQLVVCHDAHLGRISDRSDLVEDLTYEELQTIPLHNGARIPLLKDVLDLAQKRAAAVVVEIKIKRHTQKICELLDAYMPHVDITVASFRHDVILRIRELRPNYPRLLFAESHRPIETLQKAKRNGIQGLDMNYKLLNPLTYFLAQRWKLDLMVYTVNSTLIKRLIDLLYPNVTICTDRPDRFLASETPASHHETGIL